MLAFAAAALAVAIVLVVLVDYYLSRRLERHE